METKAQPQRETMEVSLSGSHYNEAPKHFREVTEEEFCHEFFTWYFKAQASKQIHRYSNGKKMKESILTIRLWELEYSGNEEMGVAMSHHYYEEKKIRYYIFGSKERWMKFHDEVCAANAGDNS